MADPGIVLFGLMGGLLFAVMFHLGAQTISASRDPSLNFPRRFLLAAFGGLLVIGGIVGGLLLVFTVFGFILWIGAMVVVGEMIVKQRAARQYGLLWVLTTAAEQKIPLVPAIEAFARDRRHMFSRRVRVLAEMLSAGVPLPNALQRMPDLLPPGALPMIRVGYESGTLAVALRRAAIARDARRPIEQALAGRAVYLGGIVWFGTINLTFIMWTIIPSFQAIFNDFDVELPRMTQLLIDLARFVGAYWFLFLPLMLLLIFLPFYAIFRYLGVVNWELPGIRWIGRRADTAVVLDALAIAAESQTPLDDAIGRLAISYPRASARWRLLNAARDIDAGKEWCAALLTHGLIRRVDAAVLQAAQRAGNLAWALREMADSTRRRLAYRLMAAIQLFFPPTIIAMGLVVMFVVVALFMPLISLIQELT